jgi:hypothetical protein
MTLIEAIKSGRGIRRASWANRGADFWPNYKDVSGYNTYNLTVSDLLALDWEIEGKKVEVTADQICEAVYKGMLNICHTPVATTVLKELGLEDAS